jgi:hypothetical protein
MYCVAADMSARRLRGLGVDRYSIFFIFFSCFTSTKGAGLALTGTKFTCFTRTTVQILTQTALLDGYAVRAYRGTSSRPLTHAERFLSERTGCLLSFSLSLSLLVLPR